MLQRIQTVYLLIAMVLSILLFFFPMGYLSTDNVSDIFSISVVGLKGTITSIQETDPSTLVKTVEFIHYAWSLLILMAISLVVSVVGIFLYKNRIFQIRFNVFNMLLYIGIYILYFIFAWSVSSEFDAELLFNWPIVIPVINMVLTYLAIRAIGKDEALVRSLNRLR